MHRLAINIRRYSKIYSFFVKINYLQAIEYRANFVASIIGPLLYGASYILVLNTIINKVPNIAGWSFYQLLTLFSVSQVIYFLSWFFYRPSLGNLPSLVRVGKFDSVAKLPIDTKFLVSFKFQSISSIIPVLLWLAVVVYSLRYLSISLPAMLLFVLFITCGLIILYNITFFAAATCFWIIEADDLVGLIEDVRDFSAYPIKIFPSAVQIVLIFIIPTLLILYVPATAIMNILDWRLAAVSIIMAIVTFIFSNKVWNAGLRHYSSASS